MNDNGAYREIIIKTDRPTKDLLHSFEVYCNWSTFHPPAKNDISCDSPTKPEASTKGNLQRCSWPLALWMMKGNWDIENTMLNTIKFKKTPVLEARGHFWNAIQDYLEEYLNSDNLKAAREKWDMYMAYFVQVIGPMVEEALYINEMLNQMKAYLRAVGVWRHNRDRVPWPEEGNGAFAEETEQVIDASSKDYKGYDKDILIKSKTQQHSYFAEINEMGRDQILGTSMFEYIRRQAVSNGDAPEKFPEKFRVVFGSFLRTDRPNGDPDCSGAKASLRFAQDLIEMLGSERRKDGIRLLTECPSSR